MIAGLTSGQRRRRCPGVEPAIDSVILVVSAHVWPVPATCQDQGREEVIQTERDQLHVLQSARLKKAFYKLHTYTIA